MIIVINKDIDSEVRFEMNDVLSPINYNQFTQCPNNYFTTKNYNWKFVANTFVIKIINNYYHIPFKRRSTYQILFLIHKHLSLMDIKLFESKGHFYSVLAAVSDKLIHLLSNEHPSETPGYLIEKMCTYIEEFEY